MKRTAQEITDVLCETIEQLAPLVEANLPGRNAVAFAFRQGWPWPADGQTAPDAMMIRALKLFRALPAQERRRICNGWVGDPTDRPARRDLEAQEASLPSRRMVPTLSIIEQAEGVFAYQQWDFSDWTTPVEVRIRFGASKAEVLRSLREIEREVLNWFEVMTAQEFTATAELEKELSKSKGKAAMAASTVEAAAA